MKFPTIHCFSNLFGLALWIGGASASSFEDISYDRFKDIKASLQFERFRRQTDFERVSLQRKSAGYAKLAGSPINAIVGHTLGKSYPFESPVITSNGNSGNGFTVESRYGYPLWRSSYRTELTLWEHDEAPVDEGKSFYYSFQLKLDKSFPVPSHWFILNQLHQLPGSYASNHASGLQPPLSIQVGGRGSNDLECKIVLKSHPSTSLGDNHQYDRQLEYGCGMLPRDKWLRIAVFVKPGPTSANGIVGVHVADMSSGFSTVSATLYTGPFAYNNGEGLRNKIGVYSSAGNKGNYKITYDNVWVE